MSDESTLATETNAKNLSRETAADLGALTLDALRRLAESGPDAAIRSAARREIEGRVAPAGEHIVMCRVSVGQSEYTTPCPRIVVSLRGLRGRRHVAAVLYDIAAELERALADTLERWHVGVSVYPQVDDVGEVCLELMTGSPAEVQRAVSVLERVAGQATTGGVSGRRPGRPRRTAVTATVKDTVTDNAESVMDSTVEASTSAAHAGPPAAHTAPVQLDEESESRNRRRKRQRYREEAGQAAGDFEAHQLADDPAMLPACARAALSGGPKSGAYWQWLLERWVAVQQTEPARAEVAS